MDSHVAYCSFREGTPRETIPDYVFVRSSPQDGPQNDRFKCKEMGAL